MVGRMQLGEPGGRQGAIVLAAGEQQVGVGVRRAGQLPVAQQVAVGLLGQPAAEQRHVGLGLQHDDRDAQVGADPLADGRVLAPGLKPVSSAAPAPVRPCTRKPS